MIPPKDYWLPGFQYNIEEWDERGHYETLAICRSLTIARAGFAAIVAEKPEGRFTLRNRTRVLLKHPEG